MTVLELRDVHRVHGTGDTAVNALKGVSISVEPGELVAVMGPSGSGKPTLLRGPLPRRDAGRPAATRRHRPTPAPAKPSRACSPEPPPSSSPTTKGMITVPEGRAARSQQEITLSRKAMSRTGAQLGGTVTTEDGRAFTVVGVIEEPDRLDNTTVVALPGTFDQADRSWLVIAPIDWTKVKELNKLGIAVLCRTVLHTPTAATRN